jgi:hypothetical protein
MFHSDTAAIRNQHFDDSKARRFAKNSPLRNSLKSFC